MATDITRLPTSDYSVQCSRSGGSYNYANVDEDHGSPNDSDYNYSGPAIAWYVDLFGFTAFNVPGGATINYVRVRFRAASQETAYKAQFKAKLRVNGTVYDGTTQDVPTTITNYVHDWTTNPNTGSAWTVNDVNGSGSNPLQYFGYGISPGNDGKGTYWGRAYQCDILVNYTAGGQTYDKSVTLGIGAGMDDGETGAYPEAATLGVGVGQTHSEMRDGLASASLDAGFAQAPSETRETGSLAELVAALSLLTAGFLGMSGEELLEAGFGVATACTKVVNAEVTLSVLMQTYRIGVISGAGGLQPYALTGGTAEVPGKFHVAG
jgi:hypothetical protein